MAAWTRVLGVGRTPEAVLACERGTGGGGGRLPRPPRPPTEARWGRAGHVDELGTPTGAPVRRILRVEGFVPRPWSNVRTDSVALDKRALDAGSPQTVRRTS